MQCRAALNLIEGNRGLYDGFDAGGTHSTAELAKALGAPVVLGARRHQGHPHRGGHGSGLSATRSRGQDRGSDSQPSERATARAGVARGDRIQLVEFRCSARSPGFPKPAFFPNGIWVLWYRMSVQARKPCARRWRCFLKGRLEFENSGSFPVWPPTFILPVMSEPDLTEGKWTQDRIHPRLRLHLLLPRESGDTESCRRRTGAHLRALGDLVAGRSRRALHRGWFPGNAW